MKNWMKLVISLVLPQLAGLSGALFTETGEGTWYRSIERPSWNPPSWLFAPVWTTLYVLMGIAFYLIWRTQASPQRNRAMGLWVAQLVLNFFWTIVFFKLHEPGWAKVEIAVLWFMILLTIFAFARINKLAAWLLVPYISWVSFASILTFTIWQMNK